MLVVGACEAFSGFSLKANNATRRDTFVTLFLSTGILFDPQPSPSGICVG
jgi:hypothetical protein